MAKAGMMFRLILLEKLLHLMDDSAGAQEIWVNIFQGRTSPKQFEVMVNHYLHPVLERRGTWKQALKEIRRKFYELCTYTILG